MSKAYDPRDPYYRKAKKEALRARSAFKIDEIQTRFKLARAGDAVVDLGAAPGGFLQILSRTVGPQGLVVGTDIVPIRPLEGNVVTFVADVFADDLEARLREALGARMPRFVASDMAPKTSGIRAADEARSLALATRGLELALALLAPGGHFVAKIFMGSDFDAFFARVKAAFEEARVVRPEATRASSREVYVVGRRLRRSRASGAHTPGEAAPDTV